MSKQRITRVEYVIQLGGKDFVVKPLSLAQIKAVSEKLKDVSSMPNDTDVEKVPGLLDKLLDVCFLVLSRANAGLTRDQVDDLVSVSDIQDIISVGMSGKLPNETQTEEA